MIGFLNLVVSVPLWTMAWGWDTEELNAEENYNSMDVFRLPDTTWPESYDLLLVPNLNGTGSTFRGLAKIVVVANASTETVTLNLKDLDVTALSVEQIDNGGGGSGNAKSITVAGWDCVSKNEQLLIRLDTAVVPGRKYLITVSYAGPIRDDQTGWFLNSYDEGNATKWMAVTQFEPIFARRTFPCYDEPAYKAVFNISMVKQKHQTVLSNMPIRDVIIGNTGQNDTETVYFELTPLISTYLLAFYVGEFIPNKNGSEITIYTHKDVIDQTEYAWNEAPKFLNAMKDYTGIPIPLTKLDLVAVPDCIYGAMENWGMNTFRDEYLLVNNESKTKAKISSSTTMQHEFVHNWFGSLVTCGWWEYMWLNEGFAKYFEYFATGMVKTTWPMEEWFVIEVHQNALAYDETPRHPITASVKTPDSILDIIDTITYYKAASILRMLRYLVTEELFQLSLQKYLYKYKYNVAIPNDLFTSFDNGLLEKKFTIGNELSVYELMSNWTLQSGYPVLNINKNETTNTFSVTQSRFFLNATDKAENQFPAWHVGLTYTTEFSKNFNYSQPSAWTSKTSNLTIISAPLKSGWYIFNIQSTGYYRVNYDTKNWMALIKQLNDEHAVIHVLNRVQLIDDAFALAHSGQLDFSVTLSLTKYLEKEENVMPCYSAMYWLLYVVGHMRRNHEAYEKIKNMYEGSSTSFKSLYGVIEDFNVEIGSHLGLALSPYLFSLVIVKLTKEIQGYVGRLAGYMYKKLESLVSNGTTDFNLMAWSSFSYWACMLDYTYCTMKALEYFTKWQSGEKISADIKDAAFCMGVKHSTGDSTFNKMFQLYTTTTSISEKSSAELALGCSTNRTQLTEYINHIFDGPKGQIKEKNYMSIVNAIPLTPLGIDVLYEFLSINLNRILKEVKNGESIVTGIYSILASSVNDDDEIEKIKCLKDNTILTPSVKSSFDYSFDDVNSNLAWFNLYSDTIGQWAIKNEEEEKK